MFERRYRTASEAMSRRWHRKASSRRRPAGHPQFAPGPIGGGIIIRTWSGIWAALAELRGQPFLPFCGSKLDRRSPRVLRFAPRPGSGPDGYRGESDGPEFARTGPASLLADLAAVSAPPRHNLGLPRLRGAGQM